MLWQFCAGFSRRASPLAIAAPLNQESCTSACVELESANTDKSKLAFQSIAFLQTLLAALSASHVCLTQECSNSYINDRIWTVRSGQISDCRCAKPSHGSSRVQHCSSLRRSLLFRLIRRCSLGNSVTPNSQSCPSAELMPSGPGHFLIWIVAGLAIMHQGAVVACGEIRRV